MELLDKPIVLRLNKVWQKVGISTVRDAITAMNSGDDFLKAAVGVDVHYERKIDGSWDFDSQPDLIPVSFSDWINLEIREFDDVIHTPRLTIRIPTVIIAINYSKLHKVQPHPTKKGIRDRDGSRCQITGRMLDKNEGNVDHNIPRSRGGKDTWENLMWMDKKLNSLKKDRTLEEMGWKPIRKPIAPRAIPVSETIRVLKHRDWRFFF